MLGYIKDCSFLLQCYCIVTLFCASFDFLEFIIQYIRFGKFGDAHSCLFMLALTCIFVLLDLFYLLWIFQAKEKLPKDIAAYVQRALLGFANEMSLNLIKHAKKAVSRVSFSSKQSK